MPHVKPQLSIYERWLLVQRVTAGRPMAHIAADSTTPSAGYASLLLHPGV